MLDSLLRGVRREIGRGNGHGQADPGYQFCYDGAGGMCAECPVEHNRKACRLSEGEQLERWIAWHVDRMLTDPVGWEDLAVYNVTLPDPNPGALMLFVMCYDMAQDTDNEAMPGRPAPLRARPAAAGQRARREPGREGQAVARGQPRTPRLARHLRGPWSASSR
jgi:hypothetical protein